jgi:UrcA family protein
MTGRYLQAISASFGLFSLGAAMAAASGVAPITISIGAPVAQVSYADLDLATADGVRALEARVRDAAEGLCTKHGMEPFWQMRAERDCIRAAIADATEEVDLAVAGVEWQDARPSLIEVAARR